MSSESMQHKLDRVRRPRVQITYDVETGGAMRKMELPFVVGVMADLSGQPKEKLKPLKNRKVVQIDRDNFNDVLAKATPRLAMKVPNRLSSDGGKLAVELNFKRIDDFEPAQVAEQVGPLKELLDMRKAAFAAAQQDGRKRQAGRVAGPNYWEHGRSPKAGFANGDRTT